MTGTEGAARAVSDAGSERHAGRMEKLRRPSGLLARITIVVGALAISLAITFAVLIVAVVGLRHRSLEARHSQLVIATGNGLQTLVIDFETGLRGFAITRQERSLDPWARAERNYPAVVQRLLAQTSDNPQQHTAVLQIKKSIDYYAQVYSTSLLGFIERNPAQAVKIIRGPGTNQIAHIRNQFHSFLTREEHLGANRDDRARQTAHTAVLIGAIGLAAALMFLLATAAYLVRAIARPIRLAAGASSQLATGDLTVRLPTGGPGEVGQLEGSFNAMADSLQRGRDDLEERNRRLVESERLKTELVSNVSHELRTPLSSILGFSDLMLKRDVDADDRRRYLEVIRSESARLATLLNDLLDLQRHERGVLELIEDEFDLNELLQVQVTLYSAQSELHELTFRPAPEPLEVIGDRDRLAQVVGNLLSNAIKYSPNGGQVGVTAALIRGDAWVWVRDEGLGIPEDHQQQIFTKFFRGDAARKRGIAGTGLGLVLAQQIVEAHGGSIGFDSEAGRGSTFWIRIPATPAESSADDSSAAADHDAKTRHRV
jgi:signal transduction histidine kinase